MKKVFPFYFILLFVVGCGRTDSDLLRDISGVWRSSGQPFILYVDGVSSEKWLIVNDNYFPATVGSVDAKNGVVNFNVSVAHGQSVTWTFKENPDLGEEAVRGFKFIAENGESWNLEFVRSFTQNDIDYMEKQKIREKAYAAAAEVSSGGWNATYAQGIMEYSSQDADGNGLSISCSSDRPISALAVIAGNYFSSDSSDGFSVAVDGEQFSNPFYTDCRVCAQNFDVFWKKLRVAKHVVIFQNGVQSEVSTLNITETLPDLGSGEHECRVAF